MLNKLFKAAEEDKNKDRWKDDDDEDDYEDDEYDEHIKPVWPVRFICLARFQTHKRDADPFKVNYSRSNMWK